MSHENSEKRYAKWPGDYPYAVLSVRNATRHRAGRYAVFPVFVPRPTLPNVPASVRIVLKKWRRTVLRLWHAGYPPLVGARNPKLAAAYMRNCPPFGVRTADTGRCCRQAAVCPWCYGRANVTEVFGRFERLLFGPANATKPGRQVPLDPGTRVVAFRVRVARTGAPGTPHLQAAPEVHGVAVRAAMARRDTEVRKMHADHALVRHQAVPDGDGSGLIVTRCGVMLVPGGVPDAQDAAYRAAGGRIRQLPPTRAGLLAAVKFAFRYPPGLARAPARAVVATAAAVHRLRTAVWYGSYKETGGVKKRHRVPRGEQS